MRADVPSISLKLSKVSIPAPAIDLSTEDKIRDHVARTFYYGGMVNGDWDTAASVLHDDVIWSVPSDSAIGGMWHEKEAVVAIGKRVASGGIKVGIARLEYAREKVAVVLHNQGSREGKMLDEHLTAVFTVSDGLAVFIETFISDLLMIDAFLPKA